MKHRIALALHHSACALAGIFICAAAAAADLSIGISADVTSLDPHYVATQHNVAIGWNVFDALTRVDERARIIPGIATSWRAVNPTTWEFKLRKGVKFHDGSELTADDVAYSLVRPLAIAGSPGGFAVYVRRIISKEIIDPYTIRLKTATPYGAMPQDLNAIMIVSKKAALNATPADFDSGKAMIGSGPYKFVRWARGDRVELARFEGYWDKQPAWDKVTFRMMSNDPARTAALLSGDVDVIENVPPSDIARMRANANVHMEQTVSWRTIFFQMDQYRTQPLLVTDLDGKPLGKNPFMDVRVRRAISKAINRKALVERAMENVAVPASNSVSPQIFGHQADIKIEAFDPDGAKKLLAEAGYPNGFGLTVAAPSDRYINDDQVAQAVAQMLSRIGIKCAVEAMPFNVYLSKARDQQFSFAMLGWGSYAADLALRALLMTPNVDKGNGAWNWGRYSNPKMDKLVEDALDTVDDKKREALAREAGAAAAADVAIIPLHHQIVTWAMKKNIAYQARTDERSLAQFFFPK
ncbi:MAG: ABC transporter substrate-binding protein [Proteobacteria bacterium]|nr:ABC transporter substrate-binding protein [Pseudomonadota bacterium]